MLIVRKDIVIDVMERGAGPAALLLHSAGLGATQWRELARELSGSFRCIAPNLRGYGRSSPWPPARQTELDAELELLDGVIGQSPRPLHLVGHSMGAWLALHLAARDARRFRTLTLIEPVILGALRASGDAAALAEFEGMIAAVLDAFARGDANAALERFTDYWYGPGAWSRIPTARKLTTFARSEKMRSDVMAVAADMAPMAAYGGIGLPALVLSAEATTRAGRRMAELAAQGLRSAALAIVPGAGHMAPATHAGSVAALIARHLSRAPAGANPARRS